MTKEMTARSVAVDLLHAVLEQRQFVDDAFVMHRGFSRLSPRDRQFAHALMMMTLRRLGQIDALLAHYILRPLPANLIPVVHALRLGAAQILWMRTPPHAAVHQTVELVSTLGFHSHKGLANAVLRKILYEGQEFLSKRDQEVDLAPAWMFAVWKDKYGEENARAIVRAHLVEPPLDLTIKADPARWAEILGGELLPTGSVRLRKAGDIASLTGYAEGMWWVQDAAAAIPARLLGDVAGAKVIDLCAAPGGKTAQLAAAGAHMTALDRAPARITLLRQNLRRLNLEAEVIQADALAWQPPEKVSHLLLDAPCTATGTLRRHPEIAMLRSPEDVLRQSILQGELLDHAATMLKPGGKLVYTVCSLQPEEGREQIERFISMNPLWTVDPVRSEEVGGQESWITRQGALSTLPCYLPESGGLDGFYAVRLIKG